MRVCLTGPPRTGKTTMAAELGQLSGAPILHTDDAMHLGWSPASEEVANWLDRPGDLIIEGVAIPRALRKWLARGHAGKPVDVVVLMRTPFVPLSRGQVSMGLGLMRVLAEIRPELERRGVVVLWDWLATTAELWEELRDG